MRVGDSAVPYAAARSYTLQTVRYNGTPLNWCNHGSLNCHDPKADHAEVARLLLAAGARVPEMYEASDEVTAVLRAHVRRSLYSFLIHVLRLVVCHLSRESCWSNWRPSLRSSRSVFAQSPGAQKAIVVTGASSGIGRKITERLAANGFFVYAGARAQKDLDELSAIKNVQGVRLDVTSAATSPPPWRWSAKRGADCTA